MIERLLASRLFRGNFERRMKIPKGAVGNRPGRKPWFENED